MNQRKEDGVRPLEEHFMRADKRVTLNILKERDREAIYPAKMTPNYVLAWNAILKYHRALAYQKCLFSQRGDLSVLGVAWALFLCCRPPWALTRQRSKLSGFYKVLIFL